MEVGLTPFLGLIVLTKCRESNYIELYCIELIFSENLVIDVDSLVINKWNLPLKNTVCEQFLKSLLSPRHVLEILYSMGYNKCLIPWD